MLHPISWLWVQSWYSLDEHTITLKFIYGLFYHVLKTRSFRSLPKVVRDFQSISHTIPHLMRSVDPSAQPKARCQSVRNNIRTPEAQLPIRYTHTSAVSQPELSRLVINIAILSLRLRYAGTHVMPQSCLRCRVVAGGKP